MIYYFSGTGNSLAIARRLAALMGESLTAITPDTPPPAAAELADESCRVGLVFPVYGWDVPRIVRRFLARWPSPAHSAGPDATNPNISLPHAVAGQAYCYAVMSCGDDIGRTDRRLRHCLEEKGIGLSAVFSLLMRNTYVCLPGFDVDAPADLERKEHQTNERLAPIAARILRREGSTERDLIPGAFPWLKTYLLGRLFSAFLTSDRLFRVDLARCTRCGRCARICPMKNVRLTNAGTPSWQGQCTMCLACYHSCPVHAIDYGSFTKGKGQVKVRR